MVKDRTFEFRSTIDTISGGQVFLSNPSAFAHHTSSSNTSPDSFITKAVSINREFPSISAKLEQLSKIAKNRSIFDEKDEEFESLSDSLKRNLTLLNRRIHELKTSPSASTTNVPEATNKTIIEHQKNVALILQNLMAQHFKNFENILEVRSQTLKSKRDRKEQFGADKGGGSFSAFRASTPPQVITSHPSNSPKSSTTASPLKQRPIDPAFTFRGPAAVSQQAPIVQLDQAAAYKKHDDPHSHVSIDFSSTQAQHQQQTLQMEQEPLLGGDSRTLRVRNNALGAIESTINELGSIYQQLAHMVAEQGETVQRIDFNIEEMNVNVLGGQRQLSRYLRRVSSNRWLIAKMFMALILFIIIFKFIFFL